jgi:hypothetical protein
MSLVRIGIAIALLAAGCGGAQGERTGQCAEQCGDAYMSCLEQGSCVDSRDGQIVPCEEECGAKRAACDGSCG